MAKDALTKQKSEASGDVERTDQTVTYVPAVDIRESETDVQVVADMPGIDNQGVSVDLDRNVLTIRGQCTQKAPEGYDLAYREFESGNYERSFRITDDIDRDGIEAEVKNGVLCIRLPKAKEVQPRKINVKAG